MKEDLKGAPDWVDNLIQPINAFMENVYQCLNRNVTFSDNFASFISTITYKTPSTYPGDVDSVEFLNQLKTKPIGVIVLQAYDKANYEAAAGPVYAPWIENNGSIRLATITGLEPDKTYLIRLAIF
ncbi:MAG: hypothetical protein HC838_00200 [Spirulinaceae cyanobacterium RM2_2_10]|nr:hypothetical protein [Spirulinaceae cyanobacterium RM2_2_10]